MIETSSFVSFLKIREKMSESKVIAKTKGSEYQLVSINPHGLTNSFRTIISFQTISFFKHMCTRCLSFIFLFKFVMYNSSFVILYWKLSKHNFKTPLDFISFTSIRISSFWKWLLNRYFYYTKSLRIYNSTPWKLHARSGDPFESSNK